MMKKRSFLIVMFALVQIVAARQMCGDDVRAGGANATINQPGAPLASSLTPTPVKPANDTPSGRRRAAPPAKSEPQLQFEGTITAASATSITVHDSHDADVVVALTATTVIRKGDATIAAADLKVGDRVHVKATSANNVNTAVEVIVQIDDEQHPLEVEGTISAASTSSITVHDAHGADVILMLTADTIIRKGDTAITASDLKVGDHVEISAMAQGTVNTALVIHVDGNGSEAAAVSGTVSDVSGAQLMVRSERGDVIVKTDSSTVIRKQGRTIAISDIHTGDGVTCSGTLAADHSLLAKQIEVHGGSSGHH
jgi:hypothetical protein